MKVYNVAIKTKELGKDKEGEDIILTKITFIPFNNLKDANKEMNYWLNNKVPVKIICEEF